MYPPELVAPKKTELTEAGFSEMLTVEDVDAAIAQSGSTLVSSIAFAAAPHHQCAQASFTRSNMISCPEI